MQPLEIRVCCERYDAHAKITIDETTPNIDLLGGGPLKPPAMEAAAMPRTAYTRWRVYRHCGLAWVSAINDAFRSFGRPAVSWEELKHAAAAQASAPRKGDSLQAGYAINRAKADGVLRVRADGLLELVTTHLDVATLNGFTRAYAAISGMGWGALFRYVEQVCESLALAKRLPAPIDLLAENPFEGPVTRDEIRALPEADLIRGVVERLKGRPAWAPYNLDNLAAHVVREYLKEVRS
jgi:hypothetical protein